MIAPHSPTLRSLPDGEPQKVIAISFRRLHLRRDAGALDIDLDEVYRRLGMDRKDSAIRLLNRKSPAPSIPPTSMWGTSAQQEDVREGSTRPWGRSDFARRWLEGGSRGLGATPLRFGAQHQNHQGWQSQPLMPLHVILF